ncbi:MAG: glycerophosphodiester phosphodiesterase [Sulfurimonas sp.]|uniref:glycerophosphodiester phosphodiesterase n=1 Tax=Sulfurimonas sp. TaxID=2022749 RepID=UPI00260048B9|nr:glycerophosphodiester phosphodiesterase family protein [Sulfurimonas sp.]MCK9492576.1 glycerophosphodiester phosphodiesterase [Sulfurimonas sp.]
MSFLELFKSSPLIAAHRGFSHFNPENTLRALEFSLGCCDFIEIDVQLSSDKRAIIFHDEDLQRTTNIGRSIKVYELSYKELSKLDYGSWFDGVYEPLLDLETTLEFAKKHNMPLNIELKDISEFYTDVEFVSIVLDLIESFEMQENILLSSFRHKYLALIKEIKPNILTAALVEDRLPKNPIEYLRSLGAKAYNISDNLADLKTIEILKESGIFVNVYTINDEKRAKELFEMGINAIFSDKLMKS